MSDAPAPAAPASPTNQNVPPPGANENPRSQQAPQPQPEQGQQAAPKAAEPPKQEYFEIKVDGKTKRVTREEAMRRLQTEDASMSRFEQAAAKEKRANDIIERAKKNPIEALLDPELGLNKEQIRDAMEAWYKREFIDPDQMTPEQIRLRDAEARIKSYEDKENEAKERQRAEDEERQVSGHRETLQKQIIDALDSGQVPKSKFTVGRLAYFMRLNASKGVDAPMEMLINQVNNERKDIVRGEVERLDFDGILSLLGDDLVNKIRKADLQRLREARGKQDAPTFGGTHQSSGGQGEKIDMDEVTRRMRKLQGRA